MLVLHISIFGPARVQEIFGLAGFVKKNVSKARFSTFQFLQPTQGFIYLFIFKLIFIIYTLQGINFIIYFIKNIKRDLFWFYDVHSEIVHDMYDVCDAYGMS